MRIKWFSLVRITGMLLVLLYHFWPSVFKGGFVGVDVFLVFSGFLTTAIFLDEFTKKEDIDLLGFYRRRLYRILPPVIFMLFVVMPFTLLIRSDFRAGIASQIAAVVAFITNYFEIAQGGSYENQFVPHLFVHTWTLGMEVQLYLLWGILVWGVSRLAKSAEQLRAYLFGVSSLFFLLTFTRLILGSIDSHNLSAVYYATGKHGFTFFLGAILACFSGVAHTTTGFKKFVKQFDLKKTFGLIAGSLLVLTVLTFLLVFENVWTYWLGFITASLAGLGLILGLRILHEKTPDMKEPAVLGFLANISYGVYLFHWPFLIIFSEMTNRLAAIALTLLFAVMFSSLSFYVIEPLLMGKPVRLMGVDLKLDSAKKPLAWFAAVATCFILILSAVSPKIGALEKDLMVQGLEQADTKMTQTRLMVDGQLASDYGVYTGTIVIGDSVALRASDGLTKAIPDAVVEGEVSRTLTGALEVLKDNIKNKTLPQDVVIAAGANVVSDYQEQLDEIIKILPQGHRLILVTPYDGRVAGNPAALSTLTRDYQLELAETYDWVTVADWFQVASENPQLWYYTDYVHFGSESESIAEGQKLYAKTVKDALKKAQKGNVKTKETD